MMQSITPAELQMMLEAGTPLQLIDVREAEEHATFNIGGHLMPLSELFEHAAGIAMDKPVVLYCKMGIRSQIAIQRLQEKFGWNHLINLKGGLEAWKKER